VLLAGVQEQGRRSRGGWGGFGLPTFFDLVAAANDFIDGNDHRKNFFGSEFKQSDYDL
jgi:hypothetical protein